MLNSVCFALRALGWGEMAVDLIIAGLLSLINGEVVEYSLPPTGHTGTTAQARAVSVVYKSAVAVLL
jgi:hypothetical protein